MVSNKLTSLLMVISSVFVTHSAIVKVEMLPIKAYEFYANFIDGNPKSIYDPLKSVPIEKKLSEKAATLDFMFDFYDEPKYYPETATPGFGDSIDPSNRKLRVNHTDAVLINEWFRCSNYPLLSTY